jgi:hypothetical protein
MWLGRAEEEPPRRRPLSPAATIALSACGFVAVVVLLKYALDVLAILAALAAAGIVLHVLGIRLAESDILSPGWLLIVLLGAALFAYAFLVPAHSVAGVGRYMPKWMVSALEWSEQRGWAGRALSDARGSGSEPIAVEPAGEPEIGTAAAAPIVVVSVSASIVARGRAVTLMARFGARDAGDDPTSIRFYDGAVPIGTAEVRTEGRTRIAYLTVRELRMGAHEIRAAPIAAAGQPGGLSEPVKVTVVRR